MNPENSLPLETAVLLLVFNRLDTTQKVFESIRMARPARLYLAADGPRCSKPGETEAVNMVRQYLLGNIDWDCEVKTLFREQNLGCKKAVSKAISWFFEHEEAGIILEDDCLPTQEFFSFCQWALREYRSNQTIGLVSGSNLIDYRFGLRRRNGFSRYINCWGWATWKNRWELFDPDLSICDVKALNNELKREPHLRLWERIFWKNVFKHMIFTNTIWDFFLQYQFFKNRLLSVFPARNLVLNLGFGLDATHTRSSAPEYVILSRPKEECSVMTLTVPDTISPDMDRDRFLIKTIYNCTPIRTLRLYIMNVLRYIRV